MKSTRTMKGMPKRPLTAYNIFFKHERTAIEKYIQKETGKKAPYKEVAKKVAQQWKLLSAHKKAQYDVLAAKDKQRYATELATFSETQESNKNNSSLKSFVGAVHARIDDGNDKPQAANDGREGMEPLPFDKIEFDQLDNDIGSFLDDFPNVMTASHEDIRDRANCVGIEKGGNDSSNDFGIIHLTTTEGFKHKPSQSFCGVQAEMFGTAQSIFLVESFKAVDAAELANFAMAYDFFDDEVSVINENDVVFLSELYNHEEMHGQTI